MAKKAKAKAKAQEIGDGAWIMLIKKLPVKPAPPRLSIMIKWHEHPTPKGGDTDE